MTKNFIGIPFFFRWFLVLSIWLTLIAGGTVIWALLNLPETESILTLSDHSPVEYLQIYAP